MKKIIVFFIVLACIAIIATAEKDPLEIGSNDEPDYCKNVGVEFNSVSVVGKVDRDGDGYYEAFDLEFDMETEFGCTKMVKIQATPPNKYSDIFIVRGLKGGPYRMHFDASEFSNIGNGRTVTILLKLLSSDGSKRYDTEAVQVKVDGDYAQGTTPVPTPTPSQHYTTTVWARTYTKAGDQEAKAMLKTIDGVVVLATTENNSNKDILIFKLNWRGEILWSKTYGTAANETPVAIMETTSGYVVLATTDYNGKDIYIINMDKNGNALNKGVVTLT